MDAKMKNDRVSFPHSARHGDARSVMDRAGGGTTRMSLRGASMVMARRIFHVSAIVGLCIGHGILSAAPTKMCFTNDIVITNNWHLKLACTLPSVPGKIRGIFVQVHGASGNSLWLARYDRSLAMAFSHGFACVGTLFTNTATGDRIPLQFWENFGDERDNQALEDALSDLATQMGCPELATAPIAIMGFSQGGGYAVRYAQYNPARTIAFAHDKFGHWPAFSNILIAGDFAKVPGVLAYGTRDGASVQQMITNLFRANRAVGALWALVEDYGMHHADGSYGMFYGINYLDKVIERRLPYAFDPASYVLNDLTETDGWVGDNDGFASSAAEVVPFSNVTLAEARKRSWFPTEGLAKVWSAVVTRAKAFDITTPSHGATLGSNWNITLDAAGALGPYTISGTANGTVTSIDWYRDGKLMGTATNAPFSFTLPNMVYGVSMVYGRVNGGQYATGAPLFVGKCDRSDWQYYGTNVKPSVSTAPVSLSANAPFQVRLDLSNNNFGYWSTNGSPWSLFDLSGTTVPIAQNTTLRVFGSNMHGKSGPVTTNVYSFVTNATNAPVVLPFVDDFEAPTVWNDQTGWRHTDNPLNETARSSESPRRGSWGVKTTIANPAVDNSDHYDTFHFTNSQLFMRVWMKLGADYDQPNPWDQNNVMGFGTTYPSDGGGWVDLCLKKASSNRFALNWPWRGSSNGGTNWDYYDDKIVSDPAFWLERGVWYCIEASLTSSPTNGGARLWINGKLALENMGHAITNYTPTCTWFGTCWKRPGSIAGSIYWDDFAMSTNYIGTNGEGGPMPSALQASQYREDFDSYATNTTPAVEWWSSSSAYKVDATSGLPGNCLKIGYDGSGWLGGTAYPWRLNGADQTVSWKVKPASTNGNLSFNIQDANNGGAPKDFDLSQTIKFTGGNITHNGATILAGYQASNVYTLKLVAHTNTRRYELFVNGALAVSNIAFKDAGAGAPERFRTYCDGATAATWWVDDIQATNGSGADATAPVVTVSRPSCTTNASFMVWLGVDENDGFCSTNALSGPYSSFPVSGSNLLVTGSTTLWVYGRDASGNTGATNRFDYLFDLQAPTVTVSHGSLTTNASFTVTLGVDENTGYFSTNGGVSWAAYSNTNLIVAQTLTLRVYGRDALGNTSPTNAFTYTLLAAPPSAPTNLRAVELSSSAVRLTWGHSSAGSMRLLIDRSTDQVLYTRIATTAVGALSFDDSGLTPSVGYSYRVAASNASGVSPVATVQITPMKRLALSKAAAGVDALANEVDFTWALTRNCADPVAFTFKVAEAATGAWTHLDTNAFRGSTTFTGIGTNANLTNAWRVPAGFDSARRWHFMITASVPGTNADPLILSNVDLSRLFQAASDLTKAVAVNNPWRGVGEGIVFVNLAPQTTIRIFTISGRLVADLKAAPGAVSGRLVWPVTEGGRPVAPGTYLALLTEPNGGKRTIKLMVSP